MQVSLHALDVALPSLAALAKESLPLPLSFRIAKVIRSVETDVQSYNRQRIARCRELCLKDETGKPVLAEMESGQKGYQFAAEVAEMVAEEMRVLGETLVEVPGLPLHVSDFPATCSVTPAQLAALGDLLTDD